MSDKRKFQVGIYRHFKGGMYRTYEIATDSETGKEMVVYRSMQDNKLYVRPLEMFLSEVDREKYPDAKQKYRFEFVWNIYFGGDFRSDKFPISVLGEIRETCFKAGAREALGWFLEKHCVDVDSLQALVHTNEVYEELERHIDERLDEWSKE